MRNAPLVRGALAVTTGQEVTKSVPHPADDRPDHAVESYLRRLVARCDDVPLIGELTDADLGTPRGTASIARAAMCWLLEGQPDAIRARLLDELEVADLIARWRVRMAGHDVRGDTDWRRVQDVVMARREAAA